MSWYDDRYDIHWRRPALIVCDLQRPGAWNDVKTMSNFFESNGFQCTVEGRPTPERLKGTLKAFKASLSDGYVSCFILVIMAHGIEGHIFLPVYSEDYYCYDDYLKMCRNPPMISLAKIFQKFDNRQCPALQGKPKLFIVQACRGDGHHSSNPSLMSDNASGFYAPYREISLLPTMSDYMIVYATQPGKNAFRHPDHGSPLFKVLVDVVNECGRTNHISEIFTMVANQLKKRHRRDWALVGVFNPEDNSLHIEDSLSKRWYLFPTY